MVYTRIRREDLDEMKRREQQIGATVAAQIRVFVQQGLRPGKAVIR